MKVLVFKYVDLFLMLLSLVWLSRAPDWEPLIAFVTTFVAFISTDVALVRHGKSQIAFQANIDSTYNTMWARIESITPRPLLVWGTYLNPEAFVNGEPPQHLKEFYRKAERLNAADYKRVFGIYPDVLKHREKRQKAIDWIQGHVERTKDLEGYKVRYVELDFQAAEVLIDDLGLSFSFPYARSSEAGWATTDKDVREIMKDYFQQVWNRATPVEKLFES